MEARMTRAELAFPALLLAGVASLVAAGFLLFGYPWSVIAFPFGAALVMCMLCVVQLVTLFAGIRPAPSDDTPSEPLTASSVAWIFALAGFVYALGFVFGPAAYLLAYLRANRISWLTSASIAAASVIVTWGLFIKALHVLLPIEPLWLG
jgi:hypothetical protein